MVDNPVQIRAYFENSGVPATGLTPTVNVYEDDGTQVITSQSMSEVGNGWYFYVFTTAVVNTGYMWVADGGSGLSNVDRYESGSIPIRAHQAVLDWFSNVPTVTDIIDISVLPDLAFELTVWDTAGWVTSWTDNIGIPVSGSPVAFIQILRGGIQVYLDSFALSIVRDTNKIQFKVTFNLATAEVVTGDIIAVIFAPIAIKIYGKDYQIPGITQITTLLEKRYAAAGLVLAGSTSTNIYTDIKAPNSVFRNMQLGLIDKNGSDQTIIETRNIASYSWNVLQSRGEFVVNPAFTSTPTPSDDTVVVLATNQSWSNEERTSAIEGDIKRLLGLNKENVWMTHIYDGVGKHVSSTVEVYNSKAAADLHDGITGLVARYEMTVTYTGNEPTNHLITRET